MKQQFLFHEKSEFEYGGSLSRKRRKKRRPFDSNRSLHLILKAVTPFLLLRNAGTIENIVRAMSQRFGARVYAFAKFIPYTKVISWGRQFKILQTYIGKNKAEGALLVDGYGRMEQWLKMNAPPA